MTWRGVTLPDCSQQLQALHSCVAAFMAAFSRARMEVLFQTEHPPHVPRLLPEPEGDRAALEGEVVSVDELMLGSGAVFTSAGAGAVTMA